MKRSRLLVTLGALTALTGPLILLSAPGGADAASNGTHRHGHVIGFDGGPARGGDDGASLADRAAQYSAERTAPGTTVSAAALLAARGQANALAARGGHWVEQTTSSYNNEPAGFTDPFWSNAGAGFGISGGRVTDLAVDGKVMYAATAGGGVWASANKGKKWTPLSDNQPSLSTGALTVNRTDHSVWIGTGEANTNADSYLGVGVYRQETDGHGGPKGVPTLVGGSALLDHQVYRLLVDGRVVFAATSQGLYRTSASGAGTWTRVLAPTSTPSPYVNHITDVAVRPGTRGQSLIPVNGYRSGGPDNAIFASTDGGTAWTKVTRPEPLTAPTSVGPRWRTPATDACTR